MKVSHNLLLATMLFFVFLTHAQPVTDVCFFNKGIVYVAPKDSSQKKTTLYISNSIQVKDESGIYQQGITEIGGNFYQDASTNVFYKNNNGLFPSTGRVVFSKNLGISRFITTKDSPVDEFDRKNYFIAFPEIEINTSDEIHVPAFMGIDAIKIISGNPAGKIYLESESLSTGQDLNVYNASLRITGKGQSEELVSSGVVVVELEVTPYRIEEDFSGVGSLFAFASPFKNQRSGYFAGNWIRKMLEGENRHVEFVYGDKSENGLIIQEQYVTDPAERFTPGKGYLIKLRAPDFPYANLLREGGLTITGDSPDNYNKSKFVFDGSIYKMAHQAEQLFADSVLFEYNINETGTRNTTINWIIGNSYTAPINVNALVDVMGNSSLYFVPYIYIYPAGSTSYQIYQVNPSENTMQLIDIEEIPSMSYFMIRLDRNQNQVGTFKLLKNDLLTQGNYSHSMRNAKLSYNNEIVFRVSPESNHNIYDLAGIGLRHNANENTDEYDLIKGIDDNSDLFQLYTKAIDDKILSANILPETTEQVNLYFSPGLFNGKFRLETSRMESLGTEGLWLEDLKERKVVDLIQSNGNYLFDVDSSDRPDRFILHLKKSPLEMKSIEKDSFLQANYSNNHIIIKGLMPEDLNSRLYIVDTQGKILYKEEILQYPEMEINISLSDGIYIVKLEGNRILTLKFKK